ncbi:MAG: MFS transporter [Myxococcales bacterium]|nr:MAG: MFS transporter [Myxococcales bacterium]
MTKNHKGFVQGAWCLFDWANSPFTTLVVTFIYATYFTKAIVADEVDGPVLWSRAITITGIAVALFSPLLGYLADRKAWRKQLLWISTLLCAVFCAWLSFVHPEDPQAITKALVFFIVANVAFELQMVFYNAYLPEIAPANKVGRLSGFGWGLGYLGGLVCMAIALFIFVKSPERFGISTNHGFNVRATCLLAAFWLVIFALPFLLSAKKPTPS